VDRRKYRPTQIVRTMRQEGYRLFNTADHTRLWQSLGARNPSKGYGTPVFGVIGAGTRSGSSASASTARRMQLGTVRLARLTRSKSPIPHRLRLAEAPARAHYPLDSAFRSNAVIQPAN
jgi:hypothetical protein